MSEEIRTVSTVGEALAILNAEETEHERTAMETLQTAVRKQAAEIASLRARLEEAEKASQWRTDMENAPKDGSQILISCGQVKYYDEQGYGEVEFAAFNGTAAVRWTDELDGCWVSSITRTGYVQDAVIHKPEYWMPLPVAPQPSATEMSDDTW